MDVGLFFQPLEHIGIGEGRNAVREERGLIDGIPAGQGDLFIRQPKVAFFVFRLYRQGGKQQRHTQHGAEEYPEVLFHWGCLLIRSCLSGARRSGVDKSVSHPKRFFKQANMQKWFLFCHIQGINLRFPTIKRRKTAFFPLT